MNVAEQIGLFYLTIGMTVCTAVGLGIAAGIITIDVWTAPIMMIAVGMMFIGGYFYMVVGTTDIAR